VSLVGEMVNLELLHRWKDKNVTLVGTHPGFIDTELHLGQGIITQVVTHPVFLWIIGAKTELESGETNVKILTSDKINKKFTIVDPQLRARKVCTVVQKYYEEDGAWFIGYLESLVTKLS